MTPYDILAHVENRLADAKTGFDRIDCISNIKRAIDFRIGKLASEFSLDKVRLPREGDIELLARLGLVRPLVLNQIRVLRNAVVHSEDAPHPSQDETQTFLDIAWYFLRSTDWLFSYTFVYYHMDRKTVDSKWEYAGVLRLAPASDWYIELHADVPGTLLSLDKRPNYFTLYTKHDLTALKQALEGDPSQTIALDRSIIWDDAARVFFGRLFFDLAADFL